MTDHGNPILPDLQNPLPKNDTRTGIRFYKGGTEWTDQEWAQVNEHIYSHEGSGHLGAYGYTLQYFGQPFWNHDVPIHRIDNRDNNSYHTNSNEIYFYYGSSSEFEHEGSWRLNRLMMAAFRDDYFIDWDHYEAGMTSCVSTMIQNALWQWEPNCWMAWHGGPPKEAFNKQLAAVTYSAINKPAIMTGCHNFAGRRDDHPDSGNASIQWDRINACSMFWFKVFMADEWPGSSSAFFANFNRELRNWAEHQWGDPPIGYQPPEPGTMLRWAILCVVHSNIEGEAKSDWFDHQWIIKCDPGDPGYPTLGMYVRSFEDGDEQDGLMHHACYYYTRRYDWDGHWEVPADYQSITMQVTDNPHEIYPFTDSQGWVNDVPFGSFLPIPTSNPVPYILSADQWSSEPPLGSIYEVSFVNRSQAEFFGRVPQNIGEPPPDYMDITRLDDGAMFHMDNLSPPYCYAYYGSLFGEPGIGHYRVVNQWGTWYFNKDGGSNYFYHSTGGYPPGKLQTNQQQKLLPFCLKPPAPNPVTNSTTINISLAQAGHAQLFVYDISGRLVKVLLDGQCNAGQQSLTWDGTDSVGKPIASGVYTVMLSSQSGRLTKRVVVAR